MGRASPVTRGNSKTFEEWERRLEREGMPGELRRCASVSIEEIEELPASRAIIPICPPPFLPLRLSKRQREVFELALDGYTTRQIAALLGISRNTAKKHLQRAKRKIRRVAEGLSRRH